MHPVSHFFTGWMVANATTSIERRDRVMIVAAGVIPDLDGFGYFGELISQKWGDGSISWYSDYHHILCHNLLFGVIISLLALWWARHWLVGLLVFISFHLHIVGDLVGSRGPDGYQWPLYYFYPFYPDYQLVWSGQWQLNSWQNYTFTMALVALALYLAFHRGVSPVEVFSIKGDEAVVETLRNRFDD